MSLTVEDGALITMDPNDSTVLNWDWGAQHLANGVTITNSIFTLTALNPAGATGVTKDNPSVLAGNRITQIRVIAGGDTSLGQLFELANKITTSETPPQIKERSIRLVVEQR
jgi:hypothetical protein